MNDFKIPASLSNLHHLKLVYILKNLRPTLLIILNQIAIECILWFPIKFKITNNAYNYTIDVDENNELITSIGYSMNTDWLLNNKRTYISKGYVKDRTNWKLIVDANYKNGKINGLITYYRDDKIIQMTEYNMGKVVNSKEL